MKLSTEQIAAIKADAESKETEGGLEHAILRALNYPANEIIRHAGGKVPGYLADVVKAAISVIAAAKKASGKSRAKATAKAK